MQGRKRPVRSFLYEKNLTGAAPAFVDELAASVE
jgi:hypothetical protein